MKFKTVSDSYFEVRKVTPKLYRIFYCWRDGYSSDSKIRERMVSSQDSLKKACKSAQHFQKFYDLGYSDGTDW